MSAWHGPPTFSAHAGALFGSGGPDRSGEMWKHPAGYEFLILGKDLKARHAFVNMRTGDEGLVGELTLLIGRDFVRLA